MIQKILDWFGITKETWKWRYLITCPLLGLIGSLVFVFIYTVLIYWLMCIGGATP